MNNFLIVSGYHMLPSEKDYWSTVDDVEALIFAKVMRRDPFLTIKRYLHVADNKKLQKLKAAKILPLINVLKNNCQKFGVFSQETKSK